MRKVLVSALVLICSQSLFAQTNPVVDSTNALNQVDAFIGPQVFETSLSCDSKALFFTPVQMAQLDCDDSGCWSAYQSNPTSEGYSQVSNCSAEAVSIYSDNGKILDISKADFESNHGDLSRLFLANLGTYIGYPGDVTIHSTEPASYTLASGEKLEALNIKGQFHLTGKRGAFELLVTVVKNPSGVAQVARLRLSDETWFRLKEISK